MFKMAIAYKKWKNEIKQKQKQKQRTLKTLSRENYALLH